MCYLTPNYSDGRLYTSYVLHWCFSNEKSIVCNSIVGAHRKPRTRKALSAISFKSGGSKESGSVRNTSGWCHVLCNEHMMFFKTSINCMMHYLSKAQFLTYLILKTYIGALCQFFNTFM